ncbi:unnamed protein product [Brugia timori]|uniref:Peptidase_S9_N domain-containing protein n=1 Tax=Brugia timori TaxID=42155 RepID=A0A0R3R5S1_9BILA|nr:unnamed protein product [Brugia timori]
MDNTGSCFQLFYLIVISLINDLECKNSVEITRSLHSSTSLWQHNRPKQLKMDNHTKISIDSSKYPLARKDDSVVDDFHGTKVADPYRWLEDPGLNETKEFIKQLNSISQPFIASSPHRERLQKRLTELWDYEKFGCTTKRGDYYYYYHNSGLQNQSVLYRQKTLFGESEIFLDPNKFSEDGTTAIRDQCFSHDGSLLVYGLSEKGSDWMTLKVKFSRISMKL